MAKNEIAHYFKKNDGSQISSDSAFATLQGNEKIINKNSGEKYSKNPSYPNVFDKTDTFTDLEKMLKANAVKRIENTNDPDGTTNYYSIDGTKLGSFKSGVSPNDLNDGLNNVKKMLKANAVKRIESTNDQDGTTNYYSIDGTKLGSFKSGVSPNDLNAGLNNVRSTSISSIDDANGNGITNYYSIDGTKLGSFKSGVSSNDLNAGLNNVRSTSISSIDDANGNGICSCKNSSGTQIDTFKCHVPVSNSAPTLSWGQTSTVGSVDGTSLTVKMPSDPTANFPEIWIG